MRWNVVEYVHDVVEENEREALLPEKDITLPASCDPEADTFVTFLEDGAPDSLDLERALSTRDPFAVVGSIDGSSPRVADTDGDSQESRVFYCGILAFSLDDAIKCAQLPLDDPVFEWDRNV